MALPKIKMIDLPLQIGFQSRRRKQNQSNSIGLGRLDAAIGGTNAVADKGGSDFAAWQPPLPDPLLQRRRGRSSHRLVAAPRCASRLHLPNFGISFCLHLFRISDFGFRISDSARLSSLCLFVAVFLPA